MDAGSDLEIAGPFSSASVSRPIQHEAQLSKAASSALSPLAKIPIKSKPLSVQKASPAKIAVLPTPEELQSSEDDDADGDDESGSGDEDEEEDDEEDELEEPTPPKRSRGRPPKTQPVAPVPTASRSSKRKASASPVVSEPRGRKVC